LTESLLGFVLTRLDQIESPLFLYRELERFPAADLAALVSNGILRQTSKATEIPRPAGLPVGSDLIVRRTSRGLFGVADEGEYFDPIPLADDDVRQYRVSLLKLAARIRNENELTGVPVKNGRRLLFVGERPLPGREHADVYLSLWNDDPADFMSLCKRVHPAKPRPVVMLVPRPVPLSVEQVQLLTSSDVFVVPLTTHLKGMRWKLPWSRILKKTDAKPASAKESRKSAYCRMVTRDGTRTLKKAQYDELLRRRGKYDMFIDAMTGEAMCRQGKAKPCTAKLTPKERGILIDFMETGKLMRPYNTKTGTTCLSRDAACRLFEKARRKVDVRLGRYEYRAFRLHKNATNPTLKAFEFAPPDDLQYCLIVPA
jgi:hypothetical protein